jgi:hypothetical protein
MTTETTQPATTPKPPMFKLNGKDYTAEEYPKAFQAHVEASREAAAKAGEKAAKPKG